MQMFVIFLWQLWISREQFDCRQDKNMPFHIVAKCTVHQKRVWLERCERKLKYTSYRKMHEETHLASELHSVCFSPNQVWSKVYTEQKTISACSFPLWELYYDSAEFIQLNTARDEGNGDRLQKDLSQLTERFVHFLSLWNHLTGWFLFLLFETLTFLLHHRKKY